MMLKEFAKMEKALVESESDIWMQVGRHDEIALDESNILMQKEEER
jgi:hypothetical protein